MKVFIVDDNPIDLKLFGALAQADGHAVRSVGSGAAALATVATWWPDVLIVDMQLPDMDGLDLVCRLRADPRTDAIPIVAITAFSNRYGRRRLLDAGCAEWLVKPIDTRQLASTLERVVRQRPGGPS